MTTIVKMGFRNLRKQCVYLLGSQSFARASAPVQFIHNERMIKAIEEVIYKHQFLGSKTEQSPRTIWIDDRTTCLTSQSSETSPEMGDHSEEIKSSERIQDHRFVVPQEDDDHDPIPPTRFTLNQKEAHRMFYNHQDYESVLLQIDSVIDDNIDFNKYINTLEEEGYISPGQIVKLLQIICASPHQIQQKIFHNPKLNVPTIIFRSMKFFSVYEICQVLVASAILGIAPNELFVSKMAHRCLEMLTDGMFDLPTALSVSDTWRRIGKPVPAYNEKLFELCYDNVHHLSKMQFVQLLYLIGENRRCHPLLMKRLENLSHKFIKKLRADEISAICLGFFKSQSTLSSTKLLMAFGDAVSEELRTINEFSLASILKCYRYAGAAHTQFFEKVSRHVTKNSSHMSAVSLMHITFSLASLRYFNKDLLDSVANQAVLNASHCRLKDLSKFIWAFSTLNYEPQNSEEFYATLIAEMKSRKEEFYKFPSEMLNAVTELAFLNKYDPELLNIIFSDEFLKSINVDKDKIHIDRDLLSIHNAVNIDFPEYSQTKLPLSFITDLQSRIESAWVIEEDYFSKDTKQILDCLDELVGQSHYKYHRILSHFKTLVVEINLNNIGQPISFETGNASSLRRSTKMGIMLDSQIISAVTDRDGLVAPRTVSSTSMTPEIEGASQNEVHSRLAVLIHSQAQYRLNSPQLLGLYEMKLRHLQKSGYNVIQIHFEEWANIRFWLKDEQIKYLEHRIFQ